MKVGLIAAIFLTFGTGAQAGGRIQVYLENNSAPADVVGIAEGISSRMFAAAGVEVEWRITKPGRRDASRADRAIVIGFEDQTRGGLHPGALAYALPFEGQHIVVMYERIKAASRDNPALRPTILAHVLTHEIAHILQGVVRHSAAGIMKVRWEPHDYFDMARHPLPFTPEDVDLIRRGCRRAQISQISQVSQDAN